MRKFVDDNGVGYLAGKIAVAVNNEVAAAVSAGKAVISDAINEKGGNALPSDSFDELATKIENIGNIVNTGDDVIFYDFNGDVIASYSLADARTLTELPTPPTHERLTFSGWTHSISQIMACTDKLHIGAVYYPSSGMLEYEVCISYESQCVKLPAYGSTVDWGDGSDGNTTEPKGIHKYKYAGNYIVRCGGDITFEEVSDDQYALLYNPIVSCYIPATVSAVPNYAFFNCLSLESVVIPPSVIVLRNYAFSECKSLSAVVMPPSVSVVSPFAFSECASLHTVVISPTVTAMTNYVYYNCNLLRFIVLPPSTANIRNCTFYSCKSLQHIIIPENVSIITSGAFGVCSSLQSIICKAITPPSIQSNSIDMNDYLKIYVPAESVDAYKNATNWTAFADRIYPITNN